jgi:hypothetical protein
MGYTTDFSGQFDITPPLKPEHRAYLEAFSYGRRMQRDAAQVSALPDPVRVAACLPVGRDGGFYVGSAENFGQGHTPDVVDYNRAPFGQPGLWCQWVPTEDGAALEWDGGEKFYEYEEWLRYLIATFFVPWGYVLNGTVEWAGEDSDDWGRMVVTGNKLRVQAATVVYEDTDDEDES